MVGCAVGGLCPQSKSSFKPNRFQALERGVRRAARALAGCAAVLAMGGMSVPAQTAHVSLPVNMLGAGFKSPGGVTMDGYGNIYVADTGNNSIKEIVAVNGVIPANPTILTLATGFKGPEGVAVDSSGNVLVGDTGNNAIKEIEAVKGVIPANPKVRPLGSGFKAPSGVFYSDALGALYIADTGNNEVKQMTYSLPKAKSPRSPRDSRLRKAYGWVAMAASLWRIAAATQ
jgi:sugar lactone lactonase YvrE